MARGVSGRCAGCGRQGPTRKVMQHTLTCHEFQTLYKTDPARALDPIAEHTRHREHRESEEGQQEKELAIDARRVELMTTSAERFTRSLSRWDGSSGPPDPGVACAAPGDYGDSDPGAARLGEASLGVARLGLAGLGKAGHGAVSELFDKIFMAGSPD